MKPFSESFLQGSLFSLEIWRALEFRISPVIYLQVTAFVNKKNHRIRRTAERLPDGVNTLVGTLLLVFTAIVFAF